MKDSDQATLDPLTATREELPEMLELEDEFEETGIELWTKALEPPPLPVEEKGLGVVSEDADYDPRLDPEPTREPREENRLEPIRQPRRSSALEKLLRGPVGWCVCCGARHAKDLCLGEILASEPERHGWRVAVDTPTGRKVHGVLIAPTADYWRARIMTFPRTLWVVPGGTKSLKFIGSDPKQVEGQAIAFVQEHCKKAGHSIVDDPALVAEPDPVELEQSEEADEAEAARRKLRMVLVRFGPKKPDRRAKTADLSEKGVFIATSASYAKGTELRLVLEVSGARIPLSGVVQWTRNLAAPGRPEGMGIRLIRPPAFYVQYVRRLP